MNVTLTATLSTHNREHDRDAELWISSPAVKDSANNVLHPGGLRKVPFSDGSLSIELLSTATLGTDPTDWSYSFEVKGSGWSLPKFFAQINQDTDLADLQPMEPTSPQYVPTLIVGPKGDKGDQGEKGDRGLTGPQGNWILSTTGEPVGVPVGTLWVDMTKERRPLYQITA
jgi:hypothetical protein